ncbi:phosphoribosylformylglycinamidine cyclo-ligase [Bacillus sp. ISL-40]|uniref:phosphoribosylformylglycinamidine cyclo-ligase n=1 Tax=unclassified Bacillus (in: firmicutes) TaxID=185979 RepID=UPI001BEAA653|nr:MULTISPECIES: phosphoribosylformylglycinamidine cyclo-ligase [unclassified Bacillus (in: firmicutes)]MBT2698701.1 phosphoribosylformylglycinamidine cyclo-ligase [Bacillus sp. ISL-40]MBT2744683.1 phosphoribosylformylglycinamidine cyclo-ligase [Bacillus sp. ISL-77]
MSDAYRQAGVNIDAGNEAVERMKKHVKKTFRPEVLTGLGGFGALFKPDLTKMEEPVFVSGTDGVGTKLKIAFAMNKHDTIGIDAVAMCVNDVIVQGAEPLFFLDYLACGKIIPEKIEAIVKGIADGCVQAGCSLIGGETAEMPGMYQDEEYDIAGFTVGMVDQKHVIDGSQVKEGQVLIGLASSGVHSNGFSLVRKVLLEDAKFSLGDYVDELGAELGSVLLEPTKIYVKSILSTVRKYTVYGLVHVTGGGFYDNIPRILPKGFQAEIKEGSWKVPGIFSFIQKSGDISDYDMFRTFNMGIGMILVVDSEETTAIIEHLQTLGEDAYVIGTVQKGTEDVVFKKE